MIERLQQISAQLFKNALRTYTRKEVLTHKRCHAKNLAQTMMLYPNKGVDFFIHKKSWSPALFYSITRSECKSNRHATFYGVKHWKTRDQGRDKDDHPKRLGGLNKRGAWTYNIGTFASCKTDNGLVYTRDDIKAYMKISGVGIAKTQVQLQVQEEGQAEESQNQ